MGEINRDHQERTLGLKTWNEFKVVTVSSKKAADAHAKRIEEWDADYAELICCVPDRRIACSAAR